MWETWLQSLGWEEPLEKEMATCSSILEKSHGQRSLAGKPVHGAAESDAVKFACTRPPTLSSPDYSRSTTPDPWVNYWMILCSTLHTTLLYFYHRCIGGCSLEGLMLKLKPQYFGHLMQRADSLEKTLMLGGIGGRRRRGRQRMRWLDGIIDSMVMSLTISGSW